MAELIFITDIVNLISNHWDVFKWLFLELSVKYFGEGAFSFSKMLVAIYMSWMEMRGK